MTTETDYAALFDTPEERAHAAETLRTLAALAHEAPVAGQVARWLLSGPLTFDELAQRMTADEIAPPDQIHGHIAYALGGLGVMVAYRDGRLHLADDHARAAAELYERIAWATERYAARKAAERATA